MLAVLLLAGVSCGQDDAGGRNSEIDDTYRLALSKGWTHEAKQIEDGRVTVAEVEDAWERYGVCIRAGGGEVAGGTFSKSDSVNFETVTMPNGLSDDAMDKLYRSCEGPFSVITGSYVATHRAHVDDSIAPQLLECAKEGGADVEAISDVEKILYAGKAGVIADMVRACASTIAPYAGGA